MLPRPLFAIIALACASLACAEPQIERLATGFRFVEGPTQSPVDGAVYFSDIPDRKVHRWDPKTSETSVFLEDSGGSNGLLFAPDGTLFLCQDKSRRLAMRSPDGELTVLADSYEGGKLNSTNDLWIDPQGGVYFTDPKYGSKAGLEQDGEHVYYLSPDHQTLTRVANDLVRPNGIVGTPDGKTLYIADHGDGKTWKYAITADGTLHDKTLFADQPSDGMALDAAGNVYLTHDGVDVYSPDGELITSIILPERPANVTVIGEDPVTLFVTARKSVYRVTLEH
ncbi:SMP-30/gluconolactonase/LRE family protein [Cerasicoccus frondis]|uniref:SMP-30/gluconolactonase/LRE family protein n=1 Tax=Cerasicoccus frondis TaxID=490090 RepID=UPI002852774C|nr:SMP-30/gluconolactonase/LRE family protein [Cerasicoccus frondis]